MAISFLASESVDNSIEFGGDNSLENYATLTMVGQGLQVAVGDPADTTNPLVDFDGAYERVLIGSTTVANTPYLRVGGAGNQSSRIELAETTTGVGKVMNYGFSFNQTGNVSNTLEIKRHSNSTTGSTIMTLARDNSNVTFAGDLTVSGGDITLGGTGRIQGIDTVSATTDAANKAYVDAHDGGAGIYLPLAGGTLTGDLTISKAATPLFQLVDTTNNVSLLFGADDSNTFLRSSSGSMFFQTNGGTSALTLNSSQNATFAGSLYIPNYIYHNGDTGTHIGYPSVGRFTIATGSATRADFTSAGFSLGDYQTNVSANIILDEDNMASNSATALVTQQSIKAYVDAKSVGILTLASANGITVTGGTTANATVGVNYTAASNNLVHPATTITDLSQGTSYGTYFLCANSNPGITYGAVSKIRTGHMRLNDFGAPDGSVNMNAQKITNVATPTGTTDAANKAYVDASVPSLTNYVTLNTAQTITGAKTFNSNVGIGTTSPNTKLDVISGTNNGIRISATDTTSNWRDIDIRSYVTEAEADALTDHTHFFTTNPSGATETAFSKYGGTVIQGRDDGNSSFAIRLGNGGGYATRMFMDAVGVTTFSNTVQASGYKSSDGSAGITGTMTFVDKDSVTRTITYKNGLVVGVTP